MTVGLLVVLDLTALRNCISVYIGLSPRKRERERERERERKKREMIDEKKMSKQPPPAITASAVGPCPAIVQI